MCAELAVQASGLVLVNIQEMTASSRHWRTGAWVLEKGGGLLERPCGHVGKTRLPGAWEGASELASKLLYLPPDAGLSIELQRCCLSALSLNVPALSLSLQVCTFSTPNHIAWMMPIMPQSYYLPG